MIKHMNVMFGQDNLKQTPRMFVMFAQPIFRCPQIRSFLSHSITQAADYPKVVSRGNILTLWWILKMHHPHGIQ